MSRAVPRGGGIVCTGNWIVDIVHTLDRWPAKSDLATILHEVEGVGGGAANVALNLIAFDVDLPIHVAGLIGQDRHAETVRAACRSAGLDDRYLLGTSAAATAHTHVMNLPGDSRTFFYHPGANDLLESRAIPVEALAKTGARIFYLGYLNLLARLDAVGPDGKSGAAHLLARARAAGMLTCVDLVSSDGPGFRATVEASLPEIDYLLLNEVEAARATGLAIDGPEDVDGMRLAGQALLSAGVGQAVILHSPRIALWVSRSGETITAKADPVPPADMVSPVGAGDAFCAGVILGIHQGWSPQAALDCGHRAAAASLRSPTATGGIPPLARLLSGGIPEG